MELCRQKMQLMEEYTRETATYSQAVSFQFAKMGVVSKAEYKALQQETEEARQESASARDRLERHIAEHGC
jgi:hypothetical protein